MARIFHLCKYDPFRSGNPAYTLDDSSVFGRNRTEYSRLEDALGAVKVLGRERAVTLVAHHLEKEEIDTINRRLAGFSKITMEISGK